MSVLRLINRLRGIYYRLLLQQNPVRCLRRSPHFYKRLCGKSSLEIPPPPHIVRRYLARSFGFTENQLAKTRVNNITNGYDDYCKNMDVHNNNFVYIIEHIICRSMYIVVFLPLAAGIIFRPGRPSAISTTSVESRSQHKYKYILYRSIIIVVYNTHTHTHI